MASDLYADGYIVAARLQAMGQLEWSNRVSGAIDSGATGTEILMGLRWQLLELGRVGSDLDGGTAALVSSLAEAIGKALAVR